MAFDWGKKMRFMIIAGILVVVLVLGGGIAAAVMYKTPTCTDRTQNQGEQGVDCGGACTYLCTAQVQNPNVVFVRAVSLRGGRTDVVASIQNPNTKAQAKHAPYTIELYGADAMLIGRVTGFIDLPAGKTVPLFVRAAAQGSVVDHAFISFAPEKVSWTESVAPYVLPRVADVALTVSDSPRVTASLVNEIYDSMLGVRAIAVVYDEMGTVIAASETLVPALAAQSSVPVTFTWNEPFITASPRVEILPVLSLP